MKTRKDREKELDSLLELDYRRSIGFYDYWLQPSGSSYFGDLDVYMYTGIISGSFDAYSPYEQKRKSDLWKCHCGRVHRFPDELECEVCGAPITEKSRFVLE